MEQDKGQVEEGPELCSTSLVMRMGQLPAESTTSRASKQGEAPLNRNVTSDGMVLSVVLRPNSL